MKVRNFLLVYNWREQKLEHWRDLDWELEKGEFSDVVENPDELYRHYEERYPQNAGFEVVLIGADSVETIKETHSHYFGGTPIEPFEELLGNLSAKASQRTSRG